MTKKKTRFLTVGLALIVLLAAAFLVIPNIGRNASAEAWDGTTASDFAGGTGSETDPYLIENGEQLALLAQEVNKGTYGADDYFELTDDINLDCRDWTTIGTSGFPFKGHFNGNGKTIYNFALRYYEMDENGGLFGCNSGKIQDLYLDSVDICASLTQSKAAALCGVNNPGATIEGCAVLGGKVYLNHGNGCAGICVENSGTINKCYNMASVDISDKNGAGILYQNCSNGIVSNCYNAGEVTGEAIGDTLYGSHAGGICYDNNGGTIKNCLNFGKVTGADKIAGISASNYETIESCYTDSDVCSAAAVADEGGTSTDVGAKTTAELCDPDFMTSAGFGSEWAAGTITSGSQSGSFKTQTYTYPKLDGVTKTAVSDTVNVYNFGIDGNEDWQEYTLIKDEAGLAAINDDLSGNYVLGNDITLTGEWSPIGSDGAPFTGKFSGDGYTVSNLKLTGSKNNFIGMFRYNSGIIQNVYLADVDVSTTFVGAAALCYQNNAGATIEGCAVLSGNVEAVNSVGGGGTAGICSQNYGTVNRCYNMASVKTYTEGAGVVNANKTGGTVSNCYNAGEVSAVEKIYGTVGGISSINLGTIEFCLNYGKIENADSVGGICAENNGGKVKSCYTDSNICNVAAIGYGTSSTESNVGTKTTAELCDTDFITTAGFGSDWIDGFIDDTDIAPNYSSREYTYPCLDITLEAKTLNTEVYNFRIDGNNDWQEYTLIKDEAGLAAINNNLSGNYVLDDDITLTGEWTPIGSTGGAFTGRFSGDGHTISGVKVSVTDQNENAGLFGFSTGVIMNLAVEGNISGTNAVGGICGANSAAEGNGIIYACSFNGTVTGTGTDVGGICGYNFTNAKISNCFSAADVKGSSEIGGICGYNEGGAVVSSTISAGTVSGSGKLVAAVCGKNDGTLTDNYFDKTVCDIAGAMDGSGKVVADGAKGMTTEELCGDRLSGLGSLWTHGSIIVENATDNARIRTVTYIYLSLDGIGEAYSPSEIKQYNFGIDDVEDWQEYTEIKTVGDFEKINDNPRGSYVLMNDIDLKNELSEPLVRELSGKFSGNGHTISGVNINSTNNYFCTGLFMGNSGTIMYLAVKGSVTGDYAGGICGWNGADADEGIFRGVIYACSFEGTVTGSNYAGGICGNNQCNGKISSCYVIGDVIGANNYTDLGGIAGRTGWNNGVASKNTLIENCYFAGTLTEESSDDSTKIGAIYGSYGSQNNGTDIVNCYYNSDLCDKGNNGGVIGVTTEKLCAEEPSGAFESGEYNKTVDPNNARMRTISYKYPRLNVGCAAYEGNDVKQYNFGIGGVEDWQEYTEINSAGDLAKISDDLSGSYVLMKNITLGDFTPIGSQAAPFTGKFSGNGHMLSDVTISANGGYTGIFGVNEGTIMNLAVEGDITGSGNNVGGICGTNNGTVYACSFKGSVKGAENVGGISGYNNGTISNCYAMGAVEATVDYSGGICGKNQAGIKIEYCYFAGIPMSAGYYNYAICYGGSQYCYYDRGLYYVSDSDLGASTTQNLCNSSLPEYLNGDIWEAGSFTVTSTDGKFRTVSYKYPRLKDGCAAYGVNNVKQYNFKTDGKDYWAQFKEIKTLADLENVNNNTNANYVMMNDIDLNGAAFTPISNTLYGKFSGDGHTIKNGEIAGGNYTGLFVNNRGFIMNLTVKCDVSGRNGVGGICAFNYDTVYGCSFEGKVEGNENVGGICGYMSGGEGTYISNCYVIGSIEATGTQAGGISGSSRGDYNAMGHAEFFPPRIENCYFVGTVTVSENAQKDAITTKTSDAKYLLTVENCYYNSDLYTGSTTYGTGLTTVEMTSSDALSKTSGFDSSIWEKKANKLVDSDGKNGAAYYPSLIGSTYAPSVEYTADMKFERTEDTPVTYLELPEYKYSCTIKFANGAEKQLGSNELTYTVSDSTGNITNKSLTGFNERLTAFAAGKITYTLKFEPKSAAADFLPASGVTKDLVVNVDKMEFVANCFSFAKPGSLVFDGTEKRASVIIDRQIKGYGEITVKYFDSNGDEVEPIDAGVYTVKIDVTEGDNCLATENLTDSSWKFEITKADAPTISDNRINISWAAKGEKSIPAAGLPERMGKMSVTAVISGDDIIAANSASYSDGKVLFTMGTNDEADKGKTADITFTFTTQNYNDFTYTVKVTMTEKGDQEAPGSDAFALVFISNGTDIMSKIVTDLEGVEFSFDGINWYTEGTSSSNHNTIVTAYIRFAETDELNASPAASKTANSGHGDMVHHERVEPTCIAEGNIEYWECELCREYFLDKDAKTSTTLESTVLAMVAHKPSSAVRENVVPATCTVDGSYDEVVYCSVCNGELSRNTHTITASGHSWSAKFESDKTGHWHKCENCDATTTVEAHISSGPATTKKAETCTECGYVIAPKKSSGGGGGGGGGSTPKPSTPSKPSINGSEKSWTDIAADLAKQNGGSVIISLNGETTVPADVIKAIADNKIKAEFVIDSTRSWLVDGAKITAAKAADLSILPGNANRSSLRGTFGADMKISGTGIPADLKLTFRSEFAGQFANVYRLTDGALVFQGCFKVGEDGSVVISGADTAGEYVVMVCEFSDLPGDMTNDGVLNALDAAAILKDIVGTAKGANPLMGDFNGDGTVNALDASAILRKIVAA